MAGEGASGDPGRPIRWCGFETADGLFRIAATDAGVCRLTLPGEDATAFFRWLGRAFPAARLLEDPEALRGAVTEVVEYLRGGGRDPVAAVDLIGSPFQRSVWAEVRRVSYGTTVSYGEIARRLGNPLACRAVGAAISGNPVPILVPGHRVVGSDGSIAGYGPGMPLKERLLRLEGVAERGTRVGSAPH